MSDLPTYFDHCQMSDYERRQDNLIYSSRLARAMGMPVNSSNIYTNLSWLAFNYVKAQSRLGVIAARTPEPAKQELDAHSADLTAWQNRANRLINNNSSFANFYGQVVTFIAAELNDQKMDEDEQRHMELGLAGRISEVIVEPEPHVYHYSDY